MSKFLHFLAFYQNNDIIDYHHLEEDDYMKVKGVNASSRKTKEKIRHAFAELLSEKKSLNKLTVTDLVLKADITRSAFYTHYDNLYEIAKDFQEETLSVFVENMKKLQSFEDMNLYFDEIKNYLEENEEIYTMILSSKDPLLFIESFSKVISKNLYDVLKYKNIENLEFHIPFFVDGCMHLIIRHYRKEIPYSLDDIIHYMKYMFKRLFLNIR